MKLQFVSIIAGVMLAFNFCAAAKTVSVKVQDASGKPVSGATVEVRGIDFEEKSEKTTTLKTGSDGVVKCEVVEDRVMQIVARKRGLSFGVYLYISLVPGGDPVITLNPPVSISGIVVDEDGKPVSGAKVGASMIYTFSEQGRGGYVHAQINADLTDPLSARTGADGRFRIDGFPGNSTVDFAVTKAGKVLLTPVRDSVSADTMMCRAGQQDVQLKMVPPGSIEGKVIIPGGGFDMAQVSICYNNGGGRYALVHPKANGSFRFENLSPDTYVLFTQFGTNQLSEWVAEEETVAVQAGQVSREVNITAVKGGVLEIATFLEAGKKPLGKVGFSVHPRDARLGSHLAATTAEITLKVNRETGNNGVGWVRLLPGDYQVRASKESANSEEAFAKVEDGTTNRVELLLNPPLNISGIVRNTNGAPVAGVEVQLQPRSGTWMKAVTDAHGRYQFILAPSAFQTTGRDGLGCVFVRDRARKLAVASEIVVGTEIYDLQLAPAVDISGRVQDEQGKAMTNAEVFIYLWNGNAGVWMNSDEVKKVDAQGRFGVSTLPMGWRYSVNVFAKGYGTVFSEHEEPLTNRFEFDPITLRLADQKVSGLVVNLEDKPVAGARVMVQANGQPTLSGTTDAQGRFTIEGICEGPITVSAFPPSTNGASGPGNSVKAIAGDTNVVITLGRLSRHEQPPRRVLLGTVLPDLTPEGIPADVQRTAQQILVCLFDPEQRPSRRVVKILGEQHDALKQKGLEVVGIVAAVTTPDGLKDWKQSNPVPFPVGGVTEKNDKTQWILNMDKYPWLILTDAQGRVKADGFDLDDLDAKLK